MLEPDQPNFTTALYNFHRVEEEKEGREGRRECLKVLKPQFKGWHHPVTGRHNGNAPPASGLLHT